MASRHPIPELRVSDIGSDDRKVIPRFPDPPVIEFSAGKALGEFVETITSYKSSRVEAAAGAGKSVRMPTELFKVVGGVFVHIVPSRCLAVSLHDYVITIAGPDVPIALVTDVVDEYPVSGIVFTYSAAFMGQVLRWISKDINPGVMAYMDECHESDGSTGVIRSLRHSFFGVDRYAESSATHGTGDASSTFATARLPAVVSEIQAHMPPPKDWDMTATQVPWSLRKLSGDILVFTDDDEEAGVVMSKFTQAGLKTHRLTGHTSVDEFRRVMSSLTTNGADVVSVLVVDYTFRSGFSFPTVDRIIDLSRVKFYVNQGGKTVAQYRQPYTAEVYQTKNRGGRIKGRNCNFFRLAYEPLNFLVHFEGAEAMIACLWYRMLGYDPGVMLQGTPMYAGKVPRNILAAMRGRLMMTCYALDTDWPGKSSTRVESPLVEPVVLPSPSVVSEDGGFEFGLGIGPMRLGDEVMKTPAVDIGTYGGGFGRPPSVFSLLEDDVGDGGVLSEEAFREAHRKSVLGASVPRRNKDVPPVPVLDDTYRAIQGLNGMRDSVREMSRPAFEIGKYYRLYGFSGDIATHYFPDGVFGVVNAAGKKSVGRFMRALPSEAALEARQRALLDVNRATVKYRAITTVLTNVQKQREKFEVLDPEALKQWMELMRDLVLGANTTIRDGFSVFETAGHGDVLGVSGAEFVAEEKAYLQCLLTLLGACVVPGAEGSMLTSVPHDVDEVYMSEVMDGVSGYKYLGGRVNMRISGKSLRERLANRLLKGKPVEVDTVLAS